MSQLRIKLKKSAIGYNRNQRKIAQALGLRSLNQVVEHSDSSQIRGMINKIPHLLEVEEVDQEN